MCCTEDSYDGVYLPRLGWGSPSRVEGREGKFGFDFSVVGFQGWSPWCQDKFDNNHWNDGPKGGGFQQEDDTSFGDCQQSSPRLAKETCMNMLHLHLYCYH